MLVKGFPAVVFRSRAIAADPVGGVGLAIEDDGGTSHTTLVMRHADGSTLAARLDDAALERLCEALAIIIEHGNAVFMGAGNDL